MPRHYDCGFVPRIWARGYVVRWQDDHGCERTSQVFGTVAQAERQRQEMEEKGVGAEVMAERDVE